MKYSIVLCAVLCTVLLCFGRKELVEKLAKNETVSPKRKYKEYVKYAEQELEQALDYHHKALKASGLKLKVKYHNLSAKASEKASKYESKAAYWREKMEK